MCISQRPIHAIWRKTHIPSFFFFFLFLLEQLHGLEYSVNLRVEHTSTYQRSRIAFYKKPFILVSIWLGRWKLEG